MSSAQVTFHVRFSSNVWVASRWEKRLHYQTVRIPQGSTVRQLLHYTVASNHAPWAELHNITLAKEGRALDLDATLEQAGLLGTSDSGKDHVVDAIEANSAVEHTPEERPRDWNEDEITAEDEQMVHTRLMNAVPGTWSRPYRYRPIVKF